MESVDKLREWSKRYDNHWIDPKTGETTAIYGECRPSGTHEQFSVNEGERMRELLDEIEREHEHEVYKAQSSAVFMPNHRISMPLDADDMPINLGDDMCPVDAPERHDPVATMTLTENGWWIDGESKPSDLRHWEAPHVDALLMQFVVDAADTASVTEMGALVDDYTERIREAVEHE